MKFSLIITVVLIVPLIAMALVPRSVVAVSPVDASDSLSTSEAIVLGPTWTMPRGDAGATGAIATTLPPNLQVLWETKTQNAIETTPVCDGKWVFVTDVMGGIEAIGLADGASIWRKEFDTGFVASASIYLPPGLAKTQHVMTAPVPIVELPAETDAKPKTDRPRLAEPLLVVGDVEGNVYAIDPATGDVKWTATTDGEISSSPSFFEVRAKAQDSSGTSGEIRILQTSQDGSLYCFAATTGELIWKYETGDQIRCAASIGDGKTYLGGCDAGLHVVDLATGTAAREPIKLEGPTGSTPAISGGEVFVPIMDGILYSFDPVSGEERWQFSDTERVQDYRGDVAIGDDRLVINSRLKHVDAIDRTTGKPLWRVTLRRRADASPLITGDDVWIASTDGMLLRLSLSDGSQKWSFETKGGFFAAPAILGNRLIIADDNGVVRCFGPSS